MMKRSKSPGADSTSTGPDSKRLHSSPILKVEDRRDSPTIDSEAETEIIDGGSRNNTPHKKSQALRSGVSITNNKDHEEDGDAEKTPNGSDKSKLAGESSGSIATTRKKRKAGSDVYSNGDDSHRGSVARSSDRQRGSPAKKARLSSGSEGESDDDRHNRSSRSSKDANQSQKPSKILKRRSAGGDASDDVHAHARHAKFQAPPPAATKADQLSHRAATQEPRPRSSSPVKQTHKRSSSFHNSILPGDPPRRLRNRRGSPDDGHGSDEKSQSGHSRSLATEGRTDMDRNGRTPLAKACADGQTARVKQILEQSHDDVNLPDYAENTPLQSAALDGHTDIVQLLLDAGCDVHCSNMDGDTPLIDAVTNGHVEVVELLLQQGVDPRRKNFAGQFPKDVLPDDESGQVLSKMLDEAIKHRIESGVDDEKPTAQKTESHPAHTSSRSRRGHLGEKSLHFVQPNLALLRKYAGDGDMTGVGYVLDCNIKADNSCMVAAAAGGHADVLSLILASNNQPDPDPDPDRVKFNTPMLAAIGRGNLEVIELLLAQRGFDAQRRTIDNKTYYEIAEDRKGPRWEKEIQMLRKAYNGTTTGDIPSPLDSPQAPSSPQAPKRKRLMSGRERAEEEQQKAEGARIKAEEDDHTQNSEQKVAEEPSRKVEADRRAEQDLQRRTADAVQKEEEARKKAAAEEAEQEEKKRKQAEEEERKRKQQEEEEKEREKERKRLAAEEAEKMRREEEERKRKEEEARRRKEEEEKKRKEEEEERKRRDAEEEERKRKEEEEKRRKEEEERKRKAAEEADRISKKLEEEARLLREVIERREREKEARQRYLELMPRALRRALLAESRYPRDRLPGDEHAYKKILKDWLPLWLVRRDTIDPTCPDDLKEELWIPNFQPAVFLYHDRLDTGKKSLGWQTLPMTHEGREKLWQAAPLSDWLVKDEKWIMAPLDKIKTSGLPFTASSSSSVIIDWGSTSDEAKAKWAALPEDQVFWVRASDFIADTKPEKAPHLKGFRLTTTSWSLAGSERGSSSSSSSSQQQQPTPSPDDYVDGEATPKVSNFPSSIWSLTGK